MPGGPFLPAHTWVEGGQGQGIGQGRKLAENGRAQTCGRLNRPAYAFRRAVRPPALPSWYIPFCPRGVRHPRNGSAPHLPVASAESAAVWFGAVREDGVAIRSTGVGGAVRRVARTRRRSPGRVISGMPPALHRSPRGGRYRSATGAHKVPPGYVRGHAGALPSAARSGMLRGTLAAPASPGALHRSVCVLGSGGVAPYSWGIGLGRRFLVVSFLFELWRGLLGRAAQVNCRIKSIAVPRSPLRKRTFSPRPP